MLTMDSKTILEEDDVARYYKYDALRKSLPNFIKPFLIGFPLSIPVSWALHAYDARPHAWMMALLATPVTIVFFRAFPLMILVFRYRWIINERHILLRGPVYGRIRCRDLGGWAISATDQLPGYYRLSIAAKGIRESILLNEKTYPLEFVRTLMQNRFGEEGLAGNRDKADG